MDDLAAWLDQQMENQRHSGDALKALAAALPPETGAYLTEVGALLIEDARAKRRILDRWEASQDDNLPPEALIALDEVVKALALPHADRPGYREEWRP